MKIPSIDRARDELIVNWMRLRDNGWSLNQIAARFNVSKTSVGMTLKRIERESAE